MKTVHKVVDLDSLETETRDGWLLVRVVEDEVAETHQVNKARFVPPPSGSGISNTYGYGGGTPSSVWIPFQGFTTVLRRRARALVRREEA